MTAEETRQAWLEERKTGIGGSDIAGILGLSPWNTQLDVWKSKVEPIEADEGNISMRIGTELEDLVAKLFEENTGKQVERYRKTLHNGICIGNVDRLIIPDGSKIASYKGDIRATEAVECKTSSDAQWDDVPEYYQLQCQWYMGLIPSLTKMYVPVLFLKYKQFKIYEVERDQTLIDHIQKYATEWWNKYVVTNTPPPATSYADVSTKYRKSQASTKEGNSVVVSDLQRLASLESDIKALEKECDSLKTNICEFLAEHDTLVFDGKVLATWKSTKDRTTIDYKGICNELAVSTDILAKYTTTKSGARIFKNKIGE